MSKRLIYLVSFVFAFGLCGSIASGQENQIINGEFDDGLNSWGLYGGGAGYTVAVVQSAALSGNNAVLIDVTDASAGTAIGISQGGFDLVQGETYPFGFTAKADQDREMLVLIQLYKPVGAQYIDIVLTPVALTTDPQTFVLEYTHNDESTDDHTDWTVDMYLMLKGAWWTITGSDLNSKVFIDRVYFGAEPPVQRRDRAVNPNPADGALYEDTWANLSWLPGDFAVSHDVYLGDNFDDVNDGTPDTFRGNQPLTSTTLFIGFIGYPYPDGLVPGTTYYWRVDEVNDTDPNSPWKGDVWSFTVPSRIAYEPDPADGAKFVDTDVELSWTAGVGAELHYVYFGDNFDDVNSADGALPQADTTYTPSTLELDKTYYWRVDESDISTTLKGDVWSFKTLPDVPITDPNLVGWWKLDEGMGTTAVDWSGHGNHGTFVGDPQWVAGYDGDALEFDGDDHVDCGNDPSLDITAPITIMIWARTSVVGETHTTNPGVMAKADSALGWSWQLRYKAVDTPGYLGFQFNPLSGERVWVHVGQNLEVGEWYHIAGVADGTNAICYLNGQETDRQPLVDFLSSNGKLFIGYEGWVSWYGAADDARIYDKALTQDEIKQVMRGDPLLAWDQKPSNGSTLYIRDATPLSWSLGENASQHDVYFGIDRDTVADANASDTTGIYRGRQFGTSYTPPDVEWGGGPYYWRIDEYNTDATISEGKIWSFTVIDFIGIEDFEDYNDFEPDRIFDTWMDGWGVDTNGSEVGYADPNFLAGEHHVETTIVHGGSQSMPYSYENNFKYSEATYSPTQRDWTEEGVGVLSLWFYGDASNAAERMYVALNGGTAVYNNNANASQIEEWTEWTIELQEFTGVGLTNVNKIAIGFGDMNNLQAGGTGLVFFDDIRLYRLAP